jgi:hypothetical protein
MTVSGVNQPPTSFGARARAGAVDAHRQRLLRVIDGCVFVVFVSRFDSCFALVSTTRSVIRHIVRQRRGVDACGAASSLATKLGFGDVEALLRAVSESELAARRETRSSFRSLGQVRKINMFVSRFRFFDCPFLRRQNDTGRVC